jgi:hypothetical protein
MHGTYICSNGNNECKNRKLPMGNSTGRAKERAKRSIKVRKVGHYELGNALEQKFGAPQIQGQRLRSTKNHPPISLVSRMKSFAAA